MIRTYSPSIFSLIDRLGDWRSRSRALWLMGQSSADFTGNGLTLTVPSGQPLARTIPGGQSAFWYNGTSRQQLTASTSVIGDNDHFIIWAWVYLLPEWTSTCLVGRGQDGFGNGWSVQFIVGSVVTLSVVIASSQFTCTGITTLVPGRWYFVSGACAQHNLAEPSHLSVFVNDVRDNSVTLGGNSGLRSSTVGLTFGTNVGDGSVNGSGVIVGAMGIVTGPDSSTTYPLYTEVPGIYDRMKRFFDEANTSPNFLALQSAIASGWGQLLDSRRNKLIVVQ